MIHPIDAASYSRFFLHYFLQDCQIVNRNTVSFVLRSLADTLKHSSLSEWNVRKRLVWWTGGDSPAAAAGGMQVENSEEVYTACAHYQDSEILYVNSHGLSLYFNNAAVREEPRISETIDRKEDGFFALAAKTILDTPYICGQWGLVAYRSAAHQWHNISLSPAHFPTQDLTLLDIDGFAPDDIYALAWEAGVFHYNGNGWRRVPFPSNILLESLCCGGDGVVYVTGQGGTIFAGRGNAWKQVHEGTLTLPFMDAVWYEDALWCTNDYGVWTLEKEKFAKAPVPDEVYFCSGHLSARDGMLLIGGMNGAALCDGTDWQPLYFQPEIMAGLMDDEGEA